MTYFDQFWDSWPTGTGRKKNRVGCEKKWKASGYEEIGQTIVEDVRWRAKYDKQWLDGYSPLPLTYLNQRGWEGERVDVRDQKKGRASAPRETQQPKDDGPPMSRWARGANRIMWKLAYEDARRGFCPIGEETLQVALRIKREIVEAAEESERQGDRWDDSDFIDVCRTAFEKLFLGKQEAA